MRKYISIVTVFLFSLNTYAQGEMFGASSSNYAGVNSVLLNPSAMHNQNVWFSFNGLSGNLFFHTDFIYLSKDDFQLGDLIKEWKNYLGLIGLKWQLNPFLKKWKILKNLN